MALRGELDQAYRYLRALLIFGNFAEAHEHSNLKEGLTELASLTKDEARQRLTLYRNLIRNIESELQVCAPPEAFKRLLQLLEEDYGKREPNPGSRIFLNKLVLAELFDNYQAVLPVFNQLPPHARIGIAFGPEDSIIEVFQLEASLFEDMAILFNKTLNLESNTDIQLGSEDFARKRKEGNALRRSTVKAAFNLLEGYLNSLAADVILTTINDQEELSSEDSRLLREWDEEKDRSYHLSLRDKLLQYPKRALKSKHPPLQESNCPPMAVILELEQRLRHSLIHPRPHDVLNDPDLAREQQYMAVTTETCSLIIDSVIELIRQIEEAIDSRFGNAELWIFDRDEDSGRFPEETFY